MFIWCALVIHERQFVCRQIKRDLGVFLTKKQPSGFSQRRLLTSGWKPGVKCTQTVREGTLETMGKGGEGGDNSQKNHVHFQSKVTPYRINTISTIHASCL